MLHIHNFSKPIASRYVSFNTRDIIFECRCGDRKVKNIFKQFGESFPIETNTLISINEFNNILNEK